MHEHDCSEPENAGDRQRQQDRDDHDGQHNVLVDDATSATGVVDGLWNEAQIVAGEGVSFTGKLKIEA